MRDMATSLASISYTQSVLDKETGTLLVIAECIDCGAKHDGDDPDEIEVWIIHHQSSGCD